MSRANTLDRRAVVAALLAERGDLLVVAGLGAPNWDVAAAGDNPLTFPLWGAMGSAAIAAGCGFTRSEAIREMAAVEALRARLKARQGPLFAQIKIAADTPPLVMPPRDGALLKNRFRAALLGADAALA